MNNQHPNKPILLKEIQDPTQADRKMMIQSVANEAACLICSAFPVDTVCVFSPAVSKPFGASPGRVTQYFYGLCLDCAASDAMEDAPCIIKKELKRRNRKQFKKNQRKSEVRI